MPGIKTMWQSTKTMWASGIRGKLLVLVAVAMLLNCCGFYTAALFIPSAVSWLLPGTDSTNKAEVTVEIKETDTPVPPTNTPIPPTDTPIPPTNTPVPPTDTPAPPTNTPVPPTGTPIPPTNTPVPVVIPGYDITEITDISTANAARYTLAVTTDFPISQESIIAICTEVVEYQKRKGSFNAVAIFVNDIRSSGGGYSIAKCEYSPGGVWVDAGTISPGDYSTHEFVYNYTPKVSNPDEALQYRPSERDIQLCDDWFALTLELMKTNDDVIATEEQAFQEVAAKQSVSVENVRIAVEKCTFWPFW